MQDGRLTACSLHARVIHVHELSVQLPSLQSRRQNGDHWRCDRLGAALACEHRRKFTDSTSVGPEV